MNTVEVWNEGDKSRGICESCRAIVDTRFEFRDYQLNSPCVVVPALLVAVCSTCDCIVSIPIQSSARLNAARRAGEER